MKLLAKKGSAKKDLSTEIGLYIEVLPELVTIASKNKKSIVCDQEKIVSVDHWGKAITELIKRNKIATGTQVEIILGKGLYDSFVIDKPNIPREEVAAALPFLLKDLVSDPHADIIADGVNSPISGKMQTYVVSKRTVGRLNEIILSSGLKLTRITIDEMKIGALVSASASELLLYRRGNGRLHLFAYQRQVLCLQRSLRGFESGLSSTDNNDLLDTLALDVQRTMDYFGTQLRGNSISKIYIHCDDENNQIIAEGMFERLNVETVTLELLSQATKNDEHAESYSQQLLRAIVARADVAPEFNLFPAYLRPVDKFFNVKLLLNIAVVGILIIVGAFLFMANMQKGLSAQEATLQTHLVNSQKILNIKKAELAAHQPSKQLIQTRNELNEHYKQTKVVLNEMAKYDRDATQIFSPLLTAFSTVNRPDLSLVHLAILPRIIAKPTPNKNINTSQNMSTSIADRNLVLSGITNKRNAIPEWLNSFSDIKELRSYRFEEVVMKKDAKDESLIHFDLKTSSGSKNVDGTFGITDAKVKTK